MKANLLAVLLFGIVAVSLVSCDSDADELTALTRDGLSRKNPDELLGGFFPAWAAVLYTLAASSLAMAIIGFLGYAFGICQRPNPEYDTYVA